MAGPGGRSPSIPATQSGILLGSGADALVSACPTGALVMALGAGSGAR